MKFSEGKKFLLEIGIAPGIQLTFVEYEKILQDCRNKYGDNRASFLKDLFTPLTRRIEESHCQYLFDYKNWDSLKEVWE